VGEWQGRARAVDGLNCPQAPKLTPNPVHVALHMIPAVPAKKKIR
jgi:hypothetical protein